MIVVPKIEFLFRLQFTPAVILTLFSFKSSCTTLPSLYLFVDVLNTQIPAGFLQVWSWGALGSGQVKLSSLKLALYKMFSNQIKAELVNICCK